MGVTGLIKIKRTPLPQMKIINNKEVCTYICDFTKGSDSTGAIHIFLQEIREKIHYLITIGFIIKMSNALWEPSCCMKSKIRKYYLSCHVLRQTEKEKLFINQRNETTPARMAKGFAWKRNIKPCCTQDLLTNSPYPLPYNFYGVRSENFILDHQAIL